MIKKGLITIVLAFAMLMPASKADEGMWPPFLIPDMLFNEMSDMGLNITPEQMFSFTETSLKDAIVSFGGFCTGEIISDKGLLLTNHHCGFGQVQSHSSLENDYLNDGFWAKKLEDELPNPGLFVRFLVSVEEVTSQMLDGIKNTDTEEKRDSIIKARANEISNKAMEGSHLKANVRSLFAGNAYYLFIYEDYTDVRLVGSPPNSIGKFGGDTDNWMWPRHTGDFMLFRIYTGPDGKPADFHEDNIPLKPKHHLPVSIKGVKDNDFAMIFGYPGRTERYLTSHGIEYNLEMMYPIRIDIRRKKLDIMDEAMLQDDLVRIQYASKHARIANFWKNFIGMNQALQKHKVADKKRKLEQEFMAWVIKDKKRKAEYGSTMKLFEDSYLGERKTNSFLFIHSEALSTGPELYRLALMAERLLEALEQDTDSPEKLELQVQRFKSGAARMYDNLNIDVDRKLWAAMMETYYKNIAPHLIPDIFKEIVRDFNNDFDKFADYVYANSVFADLEKLNNFIENPNAETIKKDWIYRVAQATSDKMDEVYKSVEQYQVMRTKAERLFLKGLMEMNPNYNFYPDANSTMRFTYGTIGGYYPADAVYYDYLTTIEGLMEKENPNHHEFVVPAKLKELFERKDYGEYAENGVLYVNFISNNDITGGNSGSPVINGDGHLIGLAFDGNWEAMSGDILFEPSVQRTINVDIRYVLFIIDKFAGARHLIDEMTIVK
jgi:hypothetical protein